MVFFMLFAVKTGHFLGTDSLSGHQKETGKKKTGSPTFLIVGYPKITLIFLDMLIVIIIIFLTILTIIFLCVLLGFCKAL